MSSAPLLRVLDEPSLEFGHSQLSADPHAGLGLFGPFDLSRPERPGSLNYGVVGTETGVAGFSAFAETLSSPIISAEPTETRGQSKTPFLWPPFPGFEAVFHIPWNAPSWSACLDSLSLERATAQGDPYQRAFETTNLYLEQIRRAAARDEAPRVIVCVIPDSVWMHGRPLSRPPDGVRTVSKPTIDLRRGQPDLFNFYDPKQYALSRDFRRQLKARGMEFNIPIQLVRESTLRLRDSASDSRGERSLTPLSDRAWNLASTLYYKAGGRAWRLNSARHGVCYVGLAFRRVEHASDSRTACCAAQMFLDTGDGVVFRGEFGPWYSPERKHFQLSPEEARKLLSGVIRVYEEQGGPPLREIFLHSRSGISAEEFGGYLAACPKGAKVIGIRVQRDRIGFRAYRHGAFSVMRGTYWQSNARTAFLWTTGFKPSLMTYDGWETPVPLRVDIQRGEASIDQVARDILGLTKLNYNACRLADALPVTIKFSDMVGEILVSNPIVEHRRPNFKFYI